ncbi:vacuolar protein sorting-associated family 26 protein [Alienimonas californiensis]|uniref:Arrestin-like N-terminal domain-containing protein n=1 Tax=Alienimonas californiensis TaxID=2527989 RepID=A0A517P965_9PLAN|nr:hypothetical protein [Alienimonas californiensis]QDT15908.1 hypothetical protein CA12_20060 [Alienimonas californiensis]
MFSIELDAPEAAPGGVVRGAAIFTTEKEVTPKHVRLELLWSTRGRGDVSSGVVAQADGQTGPVAAGQTVRVPFAATLPKDAPRSFAGELIELYWCVRGRVDLPWAFDEKAQAEFVVVGPGADSPGVGGAGADEGDRDGSDHWPE